MALTWVEDKDSRQATIVRLGKRAPSTYAKSYKVFGTNDDTVVHAEANSRISSSLAYWQYPGNISVRLRAESYSVTYLGDKAWQVTIAYEKMGADSTETMPIRRARSFDTTGGSTHITTAPIVGTDAKPLVNNGERRWGSGGEDTNSIFNTVPRHYGSIGVDGERVNGIEIEIPGLTWEEVYDVPSSYNTAAYIRKVAAATKSINDATFRGFDAGEVFFHGCNGSQEWDADRGDGPWNLRYRFTASPNCGTGKTMPAITVGPITGVEKNGHDYLWVVYEKQQSGSSLVQVPRYVYTNQVYNWRSFADLGIGVA